MSTQNLIYVILIHLALISNLFSLLLIGKKYSYTKKEIIKLFLFQNIGILLGFKLIPLIEKTRIIDGKIVFPEKLNSSSYGATIGVIFFTFLYSKKYKKTMIELSCISAPSVPLMYSIGKLACHFAGCCYGVYYTGIFKIMYQTSNTAPNYCYLFPVQLAEFFVYLIIFIYVLIKHLKKSFNKKTLGVCFILCGGAKYILDFFRMGASEILSANKIISMIFIIIGSYIYVKEFLNKKKVS